MRKSDYDASLELAEVFGCDETGDDSNAVILEFIEEVYDIAYGEGLNYELFSPAEVLRQLREHKRGYKE